MERQNKWTSLKSPLGQLYGLNAGLMHAVAQMVACPLPVQAAPRLTLELSTFFLGDITPSSADLGDFFFYFLVNRSSDPNFCILEKKKKLFLTFFIFSDVKNCQI